MNDYTIAISVLSIFLVILFSGTYVVVRILTQPIVGKWCGLIVSATALVTTIISFGIARAGIAEDIPLSTIFLGSFLLTVNFIVAPYVYWLDKKRSKRHGSERIPEISLHAVAYIGGPVGALVSQRIFRHKTKKTKYQYVSWSALILCFIFSLWLCTLGGMV